jgi:hypothetical protein
MFGFISKLVKLYLPKAPSTQITGEKHLGIRKILGTFPKLIPRSINLQ